MTFDSVMPYLVVAAIVGAGTVTGLLFAFSNFVMRALRELEPAQGMLAMQSINRKIINPLFLLFFMPGFPIWRWASLQRPARLPCKIRPFRTGNPRIRTQPNG